MVVQHNLTAMNSNRMLGITTGTQAKSTEKLSSGYKINRAADDAAGLSISEKMRKQIRGLTQASLNAEDGISAVQTAEGALNEVQDMLQRMNELAVKSANGTMSEDDRSYIQDEIKALETEIDRVAETTKFNETYLLKGDKTATKEYEMKYRSLDENEVFAAEITAGNQATADAVDSNAVLTFDGTTWKDATGVAHANIETDYGITATGAQNGDKITFTKDVEAVKATGTISLEGANGTGITISGLDFKAIDGTNVTAEKQNALIEKLEQEGITITTPAGNNGAGATYEIGDGSSFRIDGANIKDTAGNVIASFTLTTTGKVDNSSGSAPLVTSYKIQGGAYTEATPAEAAKIEYEEATVENTTLYDVNGNKISENGLDSYFDIDAEGNATLKEGVELYTNDDATGKVSLLSDAEVARYVGTSQTKTAAVTLKLHVGADATANNQISVDIDAMDAQTLGVKDLKVDGADDTNALNAIETIKAALQKVSTQRSALGAVQNRLEHTIANLDNVVENTTAAESQIRDTDMATEMVKYSNNNILAQAGQAMLAQANQSNQGVLSLLG